MPRCPSLPCSPEAPSSSHNPLPVFGPALHQNPSSLIHVRAMSDSQQKPWSNNPSAPKIPYVLYFQEKANLAGMLIGSILYGTRDTPNYTTTCLAHYACSVYLGMIVVLFFQCMAALLNPAYRRGERTKWWLVFYTAVIFLSVTTLNAMQLNIQSISYVDNREFPGVEGVLLPGPLGYMSFIFSDAITIVPDFLFLFNGWLVDGLMVSSSFDTAFTCPSVLTRAPPALSLLHYLCQEYLGHRLPLLLVPWLFGYVFWPPTN